LKKSSRRRAAARAARHVLYQESVQDPASDIEFVSGLFRRRRGRKPLSLREDFCGTALTASHWVASDARRSATAVDLDPGVLRWSRENVVPGIGDAADRLTLVRRDVRRGPRGPFDIVLAMNFSYFVFKTRRDLVEYMSSVHRSLERDGIAFFDLYGGFEAVQERAERRPLDGFTYVWDQQSVNPVDSTVKNAIHFELADGTRIERAFTYDWRLWQPVEVREALEDAGFSRVDVYWEDDGEDGRGNGVFRPRRRADCDPSWIAYVIAER